MMMVRSPFESCVVRRSVWCPRRRQSVRGCMVERPAYDANLVVRLQEAFDDLGTYETGWLYYQELNAYERAAHRAAFDRLMDRAAILRRDIESLTGERDVDFDGRSI